MNYEDFEMGLDCSEKKDVNFEKWQKSDYVETVSNCLVNNDKSAHMFDRHLIAMLALSMETYIECQLMIKREGLVIQDIKGNPICQSPYIKIRNTQVGLIRKIMKELKIFPKQRVEK